MKLCLFKQLKIFFGLSLFLVSVFCLGNSAKATISLSDIQYYYTFDTTSGNDIVEIASSTKNLTKYEGNGRTIGTTSTAQFVQAIVSANNGGDNAENAGYYKAGSFSETSSGSFTWSIWAKTNNPAGNATLFGGTEGDNYSVQFRSYTSLNFQFKKQGGGYCDSTFTNINPNDNAWHNFIIQGTWGSLSTTFKIYVDGVDKSVSLASCDALPDATGTDGLAVAVQRSTRTYGFQGYLDDFALFNKLLSETEIGYLQTMSVEDAIGYTGQTCGDSVCEGTETFTNCPQDCPVPPDFCGDNICNGTETFGTCPQDCQPIEDSGSFWTQQIHTCYYNLPCLILFAYNTQIFHSLSDTITLTQCESKDITDETTTLTCATSTDISTTGVPAARELYWNDPGEVTIPIPSNYWATSSQWTLYGAKFQGDSTFQLTQFYIKWIEAPAWVIPEEPATTSLFTLMGTSTHNLACSAESWEKAASSTAWFNWDSLRCSGTEELLNLLSKINDGMTSFINQTIDRGRNIFPFSIPIKISQSYQTAASSTLPTELAALDLTNDNGDIIVYLPPTTGDHAFGVSATSAILSFGPTDMAPAGPAHTFWDLWRALTTWVTWGLFILELCYFGFQLFEEIKPGDKFNYTEKDYYPFVDK